MDFVIHRHAEIAFLFSIAAVAVWFLARRREAPARVQRPLTVLCVFLALQGVVGLDQYETHLPTQMVWVHIAIACCAWLATIWAACEAGVLARHGRAGALPKRSEGPLRTATPAEFPGN
jgi:heme A synthase